MLSGSHITATLLLVASTVTAISGPSKSVHEEHIVIIGAGPAGIAAASKLLENGVSNFVILEAEHYYGGRVKAVNFGGGLVDLGAHWVHGERGNVVFEMASQHNLLVSAEGDSSAFVDSSGAVVNNETVAELFGILEKLVENATADLGNSTSSIGEYITEQYGREINKSSLHNSNLAQPVLNWFEKVVGTLDAADSWFLTSGNSYSKYEQLQEFQDWNWRSGTYTTVLDLLMKKIPDPSQELPVKEKINYGAKVLKIKWNNLPDEHANKVVVECTGGATYIADHVILTVSLGVLKEGVDSMFQPGLPPKKVTAIRGLGFGTVDKVYMQFPHKWWPEAYTEFNLLWTTDDTCSNGSPTNITEERQADCWHQQLYIFEVVPSLPNVMCGWISGSAARYMEQLESAEVEQKAIQLLSRFVGAPYNLTVPSPQHFLRTQWNSNPNFRGSYSFRSVETETLGTSAADLAEPLTNSNGNLVLLFAGEATHSSHYSTVHGAVESGWREAQRILAL